MRALPLEAACRQGYRPWPDVLGPIVGLGPAGPWSTRYFPAGGKRRRSGSWDSASILTPILKTSRENFQNFQNF